MPDTITAKRLREKRKALVDEARAKYLDPALNEKREQTAEERAAYEKIMGTGAITVPEKKDAVGNVLTSEERDQGEEGRLLKQILQLERQESVETSINGTNVGLRTTDTPAHGDGADDPSGPMSRKGKAARRKEKDTLAQYRHLAFQAWALNGHYSRSGQDMSAEQEAACKALNFRSERQAVAVPLVGNQNYRAARRRVTHRQDIRRRDIEQSRAQQIKAFKDREARAGASSPQSILIGTAGAYTIPEGFVNNLEVALLQYGGIRMVADVMRTASGQDLPWPTVNDTTVKGQRINENTTVPTKDASFGALVFHAYKYTSGIVLVPVELMEDSAFNMAALLGNLLGIRIGRILADEFTVSGAGAAPVGIVNSSTLGQTAASPTGIAADDLYNLKHSVDPAYRTGPGVGWMFHDQILLAIKKIKDGLGRYLWQASLAGSAPDTLDGDPITINQSMVSAIASGNKTILYGMLSKYKIRDVAEVRLRRLVERFADQDQEAFLMFSRHDGNLLDAGTHPVKFLQH